MRVIGLRIIVLLAAAHTSTAFSITPATRCIAAPITHYNYQPIRCQEGKPEFSDTQVDLVNRASDPFRIIRQVLYVTFGVTGFAGCVTSVMQMGDKPADSLGNLAVNAAVLAAGIGVFFFDKSVTAKLREKTEEELKNPYLKGDAVIGDAEADE